MPGRLESARRQHVPPREDGRWGLGKTQQPAHGRGARISPRAGDDLQVRRERDARRHQLLGEADADNVVFEVTDESDPAMAVVEDDHEVPQRAAVLVQTDLSDAGDRRDGRLGHHHARRSPLSDLSREDPPLGSESQDDPVDGLGGHQALQGPPGSIENRPIPAVQQRLLKTARQLHQVGVAQ